MSKLEYPAAPTSNTEDDYHGTVVPDPFRPLEDPHSAQTRTWIDQEIALTQSYFKDIASRGQIRKRLTEILDVPRHTIPKWVAGRIFYAKNDGLQNQDVLYWKGESEPTERVLIDPNQYSEDGTVALSQWEISRDGKKVAYALSSSGSDWCEIRVKTVDDGRALADHLQWIKFSRIAWDRDGLGFFYSRYDEPREETRFEDVNYYQKLYYHRLGTAQSEDVLIHHRPDYKELGFTGQVSQDGNYLVISCWKGTETRNLLYYKDLTKEGSPVTAVVDEFQATFEFIGNEGSLFYLRTTLNAPKARVVAVDLTRTDIEFEEVIPETEDTMEGVGLVKERLLVRYMKDAHSRLTVYGKDGAFQTEVDLPGLGCADGFWGLQEDERVFFSFESITTPPTIFQYDIMNRNVKTFWEPKVAFEPTSFETYQSFVSSHDGTQIPIFISHKKGLRPDGDRPTLLYGYGGFNIPLLPSFGASRLAWLEMGGVFVMANLRGGGEYGEEWHQAGTKHQKQNVFDDFIAVAEHLTSHGLTRKEKLAIMGGSNGGLLVGACMTQRPDLFAACIPAVGVLDMLRFHKFTIGWAWVSDYGSPDDPDAFRSLYAYSPLHNIKEGTSYPSTLVITADHDDRVVPAHSFKFAAALQKAQAGDRPILIRIETKAGHGAGKPTSKIIDEYTDIYSFLVRELKMDLEKAPHSL